MRIMFLSDLWKNFPGGAEQYAFNIASEMHKRGHQISILTSYERAVAGHPDFELVQELTLGQRPNRPDRAATLKEHTDRLCPDVIFVHRYFAEEYGDIVRLWGKPIVEIVHQHRKLLGVKLQVYNTEYTRRANNAANDANSMVIIPPAYGNGLNGSSGTMLGFVKPLGGKGVEFLYALADRLPNRQFLILRGEWKPCETIVEKPNITFIDPVADMKEFYERCRITLMPSLVEDAGTIPQESAANGIPCISSNVMGLPETNAGGIILPHDLNSWAAYVEMLDGPGLYNQTVDKQRAALVQFDWDKKFDELDRRIRA